MTKPKLSVVWDAKKMAPPVGNAKEPPQREGSNLNYSFSRVSRTRAFDYDWKRRLETIAPHSHPQMPFKEYREYEGRLHDAVRILNSTIKVEFSSSVIDVLSAFKRLRAARHNGNEYLRKYTNHGMSDYHMAGEDLEALMRLALVAREGSALRSALENKWLRDQLKRDNSQDGASLRSDMQYGLDASIPGSAEEALYKKAIGWLMHADDRAALADRLGLKLVKV